MIVKIFVQDQCPNCPPAKEIGAKLEAEGQKVEYHNIKEPEGLTEGVMFDVMATPSIIVTDDSGKKEIKSFRSNVPTFEEVKELL
ncbi:hypothetical protein C0585_03000 [Candidatus Woesearchaeota archaeon]|nr:MAG: hypothetical protein C0585_03000 [Candidatus Woesearchaeota archaeon]